MKLIFCPKCGDVRKLQKENTYCACRESWGLYHEDGLHAAIGGKAVPLGIGNRSMSTAILADSGLTEAGYARYGEPGERFDAWVIPLPCPTVKRLEVGE